MPLEHPTHTPRGGEGGSREVHHELGHDVEDLEDVVGREQGGGARDAVGDPEALEDGPVAPAAETPPRLLQEGGEGAGRTGKGGHKRGPTRRPAATAPS